MRRLARGLVLLATLTALGLAPRPSEATSTDDPVALLTGQGSKLDRAICVGCAITVVAAGGATWGGLAFLAGMYPEPMLACAFICFTAFTE